MTATHGFTVGVAVGARKWPGFGGPPDTWGPPIFGRVLDLDSPSAWNYGTVFDRRIFGVSPPRNVVKDHIKILNANLTMLGMPLVGVLSVPVAWQDGESIEAKWELVSVLRTREVDLKEWEQIRMNKRLPQANKPQYPCSPCSKCGYKFMEMYNIGFDDGWCCAWCGQMRRGA